MSQEIVVRETELSVSQVKDWVRKIHDLLSILRQGDPEKDANWAQSDYAIIPGTGQKSLLKPGAEKIILMFRMAPSFTVEDIGTDIEARYRVTCNLCAQNGAFLGAQTAEASSFESKSAWRKAVCDEEWNDTPETQRRRQWKKSGQGVETILQIRTAKADQSHSTLMRAQKRAMVATVRMVTAASDLFTQDLEEDDANLVAGAHTPIAKPQAKAAPAPAPQSGDQTVITHVAGVGFKDGVTNGKAWKMYFIETTEPDKYATFDKKIAEDAEALQQTNATVSVSWKSGAKGKQITGITEVSEAAE